MAKEKIQQIKVKPIKYTAPKYSVPKVGIIKHKGHPLKSSTFKMPKK